MTEKIDYAELRKIVRDIHDYIRHPEQIEEHLAAKTVAMASLPHPLLMAEQLIRERQLRIKAQKEANYYRKESGITKLKLMFTEASLKAFQRVFETIKNTEA